MQTYFDCVPCFIGQSVDAARMATDEKGLQEEILREVLARTSRISFAESPPHMARQIHRIVRKKSGVDDPYRPVKQRFNRIALGKLEKLTATVSESARPFETAVRLAIAGNIIDFGVASWEADCPLWEAVRQSLDLPLTVNHLSRLREAIDKANDILYLLDNAGEIVFDRLLLRQLPRDRVTGVVKGEPIINDATRRDAHEAGLDSLIGLISNGSDAPGTILSTCSADFRRRFDEADLVVAKGQANYETLSNIAKQNLFFLLKVKCKVVARDLGCEPGSLIVKEQRG
jgi:hypothetical protein